ncbi:MAG TPA: PspC domain-containing protein [Streptosporangiaceae bacterium]|nr:PspC domain-containing protein [Streptosporangiaceae bacterium]
MTNLSGKRLERPLKGRMVAGVAAGLGEYFGIDPTIVRVVFAAVTLLAGVGVLIYLAGWLLIPEQGEQASIAERIMSKTGT